MCQEAKLDWYWFLKKSGFAPGEPEHKLNVLLVYLEPSPSVSKLSEKE
jgi:hypothetical protein